MKLFLSSLSSESGQPQEEQLILNGITYPNDVGYQNWDEGLIMGATPNYQYTPNICTVKDKTFLSYLGFTTGSPQYIVIFDHFRNKVSDPINTGLVFNGTTFSVDAHHSCAIYPTQDGRIMLETTDRSYGYSSKKNTEPLADLIMTL